MFEFERRPSMPEEPASKRVHINNPKDDLENVQPGSTTTRASAFGSSAQRQRSYQEEAAVPPELRNQLESIGMRTRFNVNRGYGSPPPSCSTSSTNLNLNVLTSRSGLVTENDVLHAVKSNKKAWQRTQSAPLYVNELQPFGGMGVRPTLLEDSSALNRSNNNSEQGEDIDPLAAHFFDDDESQQDDTMIDGSVSGQSGTSDLKRTRDTFTQEDEQDQAFPHTQLQEPKQFRQLPTSSPFGLARANGATTLPVSSGLTQYLANGAILPQSGNHSADAPWSKQNFSSFTGKEDF